jgi:hypothetical protein
MLDPNDAPQTEAPENPASGDEHATEGQQATNETDQEGEGLLDGEGSEQEADEFEEIEHGGKKHKLPKDLKPLLMMQQDYTRKTQEVAEHRRALEADRAAVQQARQQVEEQARLGQEVVEEVAERKAIERELAKYQNVNWAQLEQEDFPRAQTLWRQRQQLMEAWQLANGKVQRKSIQFDQAKAAAQEAQRGELAKRIDETRVYAEANIKGWSDQTAKELERYAHSIGFTPDQINQFISPPFLRAIHDGWRASQLAQKQQQAARRPTPSQQTAEQTVKPPTQVVKGRSAPAKSGLHDDLPPEEWVKRRNAQLRAR